jgi:hypothetical protein
MSGLELFVRPFETKDIRPPAQNIVFPAADGPPPTDDGACIVIISAVGECKTFTYTHEATVSTYQDSKSTEVSRTEHIVDIKNPDDPSQHVKVADATSITSKKGSGKAYDKNVTDYRPDDGGETAGSSPSDASGDDPNNRAKRTS